MDDFVSYSMSVKLKEKKYPQHICDYAYITEDVYGEGYYDVGDREYIPFIPDYLPTIAAPTIYQVLKWLRKEHHLHFEVVGAAYGYNLIISDTPAKGGTDRYYSHAKDDGPNDGGYWDSFEDCVNYGIEYVLNNLI
jgi:hypothetical protein